MRLAEITNDQLISITISRGNTSANLVTDPAFVSNDVLYVNPFTYNDSIVSFDAPGLSISMMALKEDSVPYFWQNIDIKKTVHEDEVYHCITSSIEGVRLNRRSAYRVFFGDEGDCFIPAVDPLRVIIRDISANGIGLMVNEDDKDKFSFGLKVRVTFSDQSMRFSADIFARVVRVVKLEKGYVVGCEFAAVYPEIGKYVTAKQLKLKKEKNNR